MKKRIVIGAIVLGVAFVLLGGRALLVAQANDDLGVFFLFDRSGSMSQSGVDSQLRHGAETAVMLNSTEAAGGGFFADVYQGLAPFGSPVVASQAFTNAQGTTPSGWTNLLQGLNEAEEQLASWSGEKVILIYGDGCATDQPEAEAKIAALRAAGYTVAYVQVDGGCGYLEDDVDLYYPPSALPTPEELLEDTRKMCHPRINVAKTGPITATVGQTIAFTFTVANDDVNGNGTPISNVFVNDSIAGPATYVSGDDGDSLLEVGETWIFVASYQVRFDDPSPLVNVGTAIGQDEDGHSVSDTDTHSTTLDYAPEILVVKLGPGTAQIGQTVVYTIVVANVSFTPTGVGAARGDASPISDVAVTDSIAGPATYISGDDGDGLLEIGEAWFFTIAHTILPSDPDPLVNIAFASGRDGNGDIIADTDTHSTDIEHAPVLELVKTGPGTASVGDTVVYTITVSHAASSDSTPVTDVSLTDDHATVITWWGDTLEDRVLSIGETWTYVATYVVQSSDSDPLVNMAQVTGQDLDGDSVTTSGAHSVAIVASFDYEIYLPLVLRNYP